MSHSLVLVERDERVATLTLNRPELRNALSAELCDAIVDALKEIDRTDARAVVIRGSGQAFCSGADFAAVSGPAAADFVATFERMLETLSHFRSPTIAAIHGAALGGGLQLATACDFRICTTDARLGIPSARLGIVVNFENIQRLVLLVGPATAKEVLMTARTYGGEEALAAGLVHRAVAPDAFESATERLATEIAARAPLSVQGAKTAIQAVVDHLGATRLTHPDDVGAVDRLVLEAYGSEDLTEGLRALSEKREPDFKGS